LLSKECSSAYLYKMRNIHRLSVILWEKQIPFTTLFPSHKLVGADNPVHPQNSLLYKFLSIRLPYIFVKNAHPDKEFEKTSPSNFVQSLTLPQGVHALEVAERTSCSFYDFEQNFQVVFLANSL
jgi:hypothetical protein